MSMRTTRDRSSNRAFAASRQATKGVTFVPAGLLAGLFILGCPWGTTAADSCDKQLSDLSAKFSEAYVNLDSECYPTSTTDSQNLCGFQLSQECQEKYDALAQESGQAYNDLYETCPDYAPNLPMEPMPGGVPDPVADGQPRRALGAPVTGAPSKKEMLSQIKSLKKQLRRARSKNKRLARECGK